MKNNTTRPVTESLERTRSTKSQYAKRVQPARKASVSKSSRRKVQSSDEDDMAADEAAMTAAFEHAAKAQDRRNRQTRATIAPQTSADNQDASDPDELRFWFNRPNEVRHRDDPCPGYVPTREELIALARHWAKERLDTALERFVAAFCGSDGSADMFLMAHASDRLHLIAKVIGEEACQKVIAQVEEKERRSLGDERWRIFLHGSEAEKYQVAMENCRRIEHEQSKPHFTASHIAKEVVELFPHLDRSEIEDALRLAGRLIEWGVVLRTPCDHEWVRDREDHRTERCIKCRAIREIKIEYQELSVV